MCKCDGKCGNAYNAFVGKAPSNPVLEALQTELQEIKKELTEIRELVDLHLKHHDS